MIVEFDGNAQDPLTGFDPAAPFTAQLITRYQNGASDAGGDIIIKFGISAENPVIFDLAWAAGDGVGNTINLISIAGPGGATNFGPLAMSSAADHTWDLDFDGTDCTVSLDGVPLGTQTIGPITATSPFLGFLIDRLAPGAQISLRYLSITQ